MSNRRVWVVVGMYLAAIVAAGIVVGVAFVHNEVRPWHLVVLAVLAILGFVLPYLLSRTFNVE